MKALRLVENATLVVAFSLLASGVLIGIGLWLELTSCPVMFADVGHDDSVLAEMRYG